MDVRVIGSNNYLGDLQKEFFLNRGIKDVDAFINLKNVKETHYSEFLNMDKAVELFMKHVEMGSGIGIVPDFDSDGITSASALYGYVSTYFDNELKLSIHRKKVHGIFLSELNEDGILDSCKLLIIPDAGTNDVEECKRLKEEYGIDIIILDHHLEEQDNKYAVVVNNQISNVALDFTGATMVYKFLQALDDVIGEQSADDYLDLIAVGMVGDMADTTNPEIQLLIRKGLTNVVSPVFESIIEKQSFSIKGKINQMTFSFNIIPLINASTRVADYEDMKVIVEAFCGIGVDREFEYTPSRGNSKGELITETLYEYVARLLVSIKGKQDRMVKKALEGSKRPLQKGIYDILDESDIKHKKVLLIDATDYIEQGGLSGLLANKIMYRYNKPTLILTKNESGNYKGSGRGEQIDMFKSKLSENKHIKFTAGHQPAFGFALKSKEPNFEEIENSINEMFNGENTDVQYVVDFSIGGEYFEDYMIEELCQLEDYFGNGIKQPLFHIEDIFVSSDSVDTGKDENKFSFTHNDIEFIMFKPSPEKLEQLVDWSDELCYTVIGRPNINEYDGERKLQIIIEAIERIALDGASEEFTESDDIDWDSPSDKKEEVSNGEDDFEW
jgi:single-stranded-DNA-specific exonuclease